MTHYICMTCGVQYADSATPPEKCLICTDDRQYVKKEGQFWTTLEELQKKHHNTFETVEPHLTAIRAEPLFAISQRAHLIQTPEGNVLWECHSLIDDETVAAVQEMGGLTAITISHPHFYDSMVEWSHALGGVPIYLHADNQPWVMRPDPVIHYWEGETFSVNSDLTLIRCGGHFPGSTALHWAAGADGKGVLLTGDTMMVVADRSVSFMYSYPNYIPLNARAVRRIVDAVLPFNFDRVYSSWPDKVVAANGRSTVIHSAERYIQHIRD